MSKLCEVLRVSHSRYYAWETRALSKRESENAALCEEIRRVFEENHQVYGSCKIGYELSRPEHPVNRKRVARLMKQMGLRPKVCKKYKATTNSNHNLPLAENLLNREFTASLPNEKWVGDITYVPTNEGWLYLCGVMDLHSREIVGWAMDSRMKTDLCLGALRQAILRRGRPKGVLQTLPPPPLRDGRGGG